jgi:hypothetical protein
LTGAQGEEIPKEISVAGENVIETFHFKNPYPMAPHSSPENDISWDDGNLEFVKLYENLSEVVSGYAHLYAYGEEKCKFLKTLLGQPIRNLEDFECPSPYGLNSQFSCSLPCHRNYQNVRCATRSAHTLYKWLMHHPKSRLYIGCTPDSTRHTAAFNSAISL